MAAGAHFGPEDSSEPDQQMVTAGALLPNLEL